jgi:hypothetical protein
MMNFVVLQALEQWWIVGWVLSILLLFVGFGIAVFYYEGGDATKHDATEDRGDLG